MQTKGVTLADQITEAGNGEWVDISYLGPLASLEVQVEGGATVQVRVTNRPYKPLDSEHCQKLGNDITQSTILGLDYSYRFIKIRPVTVDPSAKVSVWMQGTQERTV